MPKVAVRIEVIAVVDAPTSDPSNNTILDNHVFDRLNPVLSQAGFESAFIQSIGTLVPGTDRDARGRARHRAAAFPTDLALDPRWIGAGSGGDRRCSGAGSHEHLRQPRTVLDERPGWSP